jgi:hypothetical protein
MKNGDRLSGKVLTLFTDGELGQSLDDGGVVSLDAEVVSKKKRAIRPVFFITQSLKTGCLLPVQPQQARWL